MPFKSQKQRRFMHARKPSIAKRWEEKYHTKKKKKATGLARLRPGSK